jgi:hypothetical protein
VVNLSGFPGAGFMTISSTNASLRFADKVWLPARRSGKQSTKADLS